MTAAIEIKGLTKKYGDTVSLDGIDLTVQEGSIFGFLGPNGAGKTTTLRILTGLARPTSGTAKVFGYDVTKGTNEVRSMMGFLPDVPGYYEWMTADEYLRLAGKLFGVRGDTLESRVQSLLELSGLDKTTTKVGGYSRGMRQRLGVAQALISAPRVLFLDEPTSALDPIGRKDVLDMITALKGKATVFFSTHILTDIERVCDTVAILDAGRVVEQATIAELKAKRGTRRIVVEVESGAAVLAADLAAEQWAGDCSREGSTIRCMVGDLVAARRRVPQLIADHGLALVRMNDEEPTLEDVFVGLVGGVV